MHYLTSLRGIAAFLVLLYHLKGFLHQHAITDSVSFLYNKGYLAVDFFFMLSGFIITYTYFHKFSQAQLNQKAVISFMVKRFARIWPLHAFILGLFALVPLAFWLTDRPVNQISYSVEGFIYKLFLVDVWFIGAGYWNTWNPPSWTISGEFFAYISFPALVYLVSNNKIKVFGVYIGSLILIGWLYWLNDFASLGQGISKLGLVRCFLGFVLGYCIYHCYILCKNRVQQKSCNTLLIISICSCFYLGFNVVANHFYIPLLFSIILLLILLSKTFLHTILENKALVYLGDISYSLYLNHIFVITIYTMLFLDDAGYATLLDLGIIVGVSLVFAHLTYQWVELPMRRYIVKKYESRLHRVTQR